MAGGQCAAARRLSATLHGREVCNTVAPSHVFYGLAACCWVVVRLTADAHGTWDAVQGIPHAEFV